MMAIKNIYLYYILGHYTMQKSLPVHVLNTPNVVNTHMQNAHPPDDLRHSLITRLNRFTEIIQRTYIYISDNKKKKYCQRQ